MHIEKETAIAAIIIVVLLIIFTISGIFYISTMGVKMTDEIQVFITPIAPISTGTTQNLESQPEEIDKLPGVLGVGYDVIISNTGGDGLRIRSAPGLDSTPLFLGFEGEEFLIIDGPALRDSLVWWNLESKQDENRNGWGVQDYLSAKQ